MKIQIFNGCMAFLLGIFMLQLGFSTSVRAQNSYSIELTFVDHLKAGLIEQDVFVQKNEGPKNVFRVLPEEREQYLDHDLYTTKLSHHHNPFDKKLIGPYKRGKSIGITLRDWLKAKGTATCSCEGGWGKVEASFENLMPNAVYTMWHAFMAKDNKQDFIGTFDLPVGLRNGDQSVFKTNDQGYAQLELHFPKCLQLTDTQLMSMLAIAWHSDHQTYGISPGPFGQVSHIQLFAAFPDVDNLITPGEASTGKE